MRTSPGPVPPEPGPVRPQCPPGHNYCMGCAFAGGCEKQHHCDTSSLLAGKCSIGSSPGPQCISAETDKDGRSFCQSGSECVSECPSCPPNYPICVAECDSKTSGSCDPADRTTGRTACLLDGGDSGCTGDCYQIPESTFIPATGFCMCRSVTVGYESRVEVSRDSCSEHLKAECDYENGSCSCVK